MADDNLKNGGEKKIYNIKKNAQVPLKDLKKAILRNEQKHYINANMCTLCPNEATMICIPCGHKAYCYTCAYDQEKTKNCICAKVHLSSQSVCFS